MREQEPDKNCTFAPKTTKLDNLKLANASPRGTESYLKRQQMSLLKKAQEKILKEPSNFIRNSYKFKSSKW